MISSTHPWPFSFDEVVEGKASYSYESWFNDLETRVQLALSSPTYKDAPEEEKATFACLAYMACLTIASENTPRDLTDKTSPGFNMAMIELQDTFKPFGQMLAALHKSTFRQELTPEQDNIKAANARKARFRNAFDESFVPSMSSMAEISIDWE